MENIIKNNKLIAQFMGGKLNGELSFRIAQNDIFIPNCGVVRWDTVETGKGPVIKYHESWDWLMPVVEKIESIENYSVDITKGYTRIFICLNTEDRYRHGNQIAYCSILNKIEATYIAVIKFIKWYNNL